MRIEIHTFFFLQTISSDDNTGKETEVLPRVKCVRIIAK